MKVATAGPGPWIRSTSGPHGHGSGPHDLKKEAIPTNPITFSENDWGV